METVIQFGLGHHCFIYPSRLNFCPWRLPPFGHAWHFTFHTRALQGHMKTERPPRLKVPLTFLTRHTPKWACKGTLEKTKCGFFQFHIYTLYYFQLLSVLQKHHHWPDTDSSNKPFIFSSLMSEKKIVCDCFPLSLSPGPYSFSHWFITVVEDQYETLGLEWGLIQAVWHKWQIFTLVLRIGWLIRIVWLRNAAKCVYFLWQRALLTVA